MEADNILKNGSGIFLKIFEDFGVTQITDLLLLDTFLKRLLEDTKGLVIVDFMDAGNWDCLHSYHIDFENEFVTLYWRNYKDDVYPPGYEITDSSKISLISLMFHFKELRIEANNAFPFVVLRGFSLKDKEALNYFKKIDSKATFLNERSANFCTQFKIDRGRYFEICNCHNTPIFSILILPKNTAGTSGFSMKYLFLYNYIDCEKRIEKIQTSLLNNDLDEDELCGKANTIRRIFEFVLKIECCYHRELNFTAIWNKKIDPEHFIFKRDYSDTMLGDLVSTLKIIKTEFDKELLKNIVILANELSHDSGKKVTLEKTQRLVTSSLKYLRKTGNLIK